MSIQKKEGSCFDWIRRGKLQATLIECQRSIKLEGFSKLCGDSFFFSLSVFKANMFFPLSRSKIPLNAALNSVYKEKEIMTFLPLLHFKRQRVMEVVCT